MCTLVGSHESRPLCEPPSAKSVDRGGVANLGTEGPWSRSAKQRRARERGEAGSATAQRSELGSIAGLLDAVGPWSHLTVFDVIVCFIVSAGASVVMLRAFADPSKAPEPLYGDPDALIAHWQDARYRFDLNRLSYGPVFSLVGAQKALEARGQTATLKAKPLDDREVPQPDFARIDDGGS